MACTNCSSCNVSQIDYTSTCPGGCIRTTTSGVICSTNCSGGCSCQWPWWNTCRRCACAQTESSTRCCSGSSSGSTCCGNSGSSSSCCGNTSSCTGCSRCNRRGCSD